MLQEEDIPMSAYDFPDYRDIIFSQFPVFPVIVVLKHTHYFGSQKDIWREFIN